MLVFQSLDFEDTTSEKYHLNVMWEFADAQKVIYHGIHLAAHLKSQTKHVTLACEEDSI